MTDAMTRRIKSTETATVPTPEQKAAEKLKADELKRKKLEEDEFVVAKQPTQITGNN